jgi:hypothetical protein
MDTVFAAIAGLLKSQRTKRLEKELLVLLDGVLLSRTAHLQEGFYVIEHSSASPRIAAAISLKKTQELEHVVASTAEKDHSDEVDGRSAVRAAGSGKIRLVKQAVEASRPTPASEEDEKSPTLSQTSNMEGNSSPAAENVVCITSLHDLTVGRTYLTQNRRSVIMRVEKGSMLIVNDLLHIPVQLSRQHEELLMVSNQRPTMVGIEWLCLFVIVCLFVCVCVCLFVRLSVYLCVCVWVCVHCSAWRLWLLVCFVFQLCVIPLPNHRD